MSLNKKEVKMLKSQAQDVKPKVFVGKNGLTEGTINSIDEVLKADELVKIKFLSNGVDADEEICKQLSQRLEAEFVQKIGHMLVLFRKKEEK